MKTIEESFNKSWGKNKDKFLSMAAAASNNTPLKEAATIAKRVYHHLNNMQKWDASMGKIKEVYSAEINKKMKGMYCELLIKELKNVQENSREWFAILLLIAQTLINKTSVKREL